MKKTKFLSLLLVFVLACSLLVACGTGSATEASQEAAGTYPTGPVSVICHNNAGGSVDTTCRLLADFASQKLGQTFVVENVGAAGGRAANAQVFTSNADGYTIGTENVLTLLIGQAAFEGQYESLDFSHIFGYIETGHVLCVTEDSPIQTMDDLVELLKSGRTTCATFGKGSSSHLQMIEIADALGVKDNVAYVHFDGTSPQLTALLGKNTDFAITGYGAFSKTEGLRALAVADNVRDKFLSDVPTLAECGIEAPIATQIWGFLAAPNTPDEIVKVLNDTFKEAVNDPTVVDGFTKISLTPTVIETADFIAKINEQNQMVQDNLAMLTE